MRTLSLDAEVDEGGSNLFRPTINKKGTIIDISFVDVGLYFRAERISESLERISAEITVSMDITSDRGVRRERILWSRASLLDDRSKDAFVQSLEHATEDKSLRPISYDEVTSEAFGCIISAHREGESVEELSDLSTSTGRVFHLRPLLLSKVPNLIWAQGGSFKSYFAQLCCVMTDRGYSDYGLSVKSPAKALYLDWEESLDTFKRRILSIQRNLFPNPETSGILWKKMYQPFASSIEEISKIVRDRQVEFLVIDSMNPALGGMSIDSQAVEKFFEALGVLNVTSLILDHANRSHESNASGTPAIYGSAFKYNRSRMVYEIKKKQESLAGEIQVVLYHRKTNDFKIQSPRGFNIKFDMREVEEEGDTEGYKLDLIHSVKFTPLRLGDADDEFLKTQPLSEVARELVDAHGPTAIGELAESIAMIKEQELSMSVMTNVVRGSKLLELDDEGIVSVTYNQNPPSNGSLVNQLQTMGAEVIERRDREN